MRQKLFSSEFWVPGAALSDYQIWFSKREGRPVNQNYNNLFSVVWVQPCNRENQLKKIKSKWIKANQLTGGKKKILSRHMTILKNRFVSQAPASAPGSASGSVYKHKKLVWVSVLKRWPLTCFLFSDTHFELLCHWYLMAIQAGWEY